MIKSKYLLNEAFHSGKSHADVKVSLAKCSTEHIVSKDNAKCFYDYAEDYFKLEAIIEKAEGRKLTQDERLVLLAIIS